MSRGRRVVGREVVARRCKVWGREKEAGRGWQAVGKVCQQGRLQGHGDKRKGGKGRGREAAAQAGQFGRHRRTAWHREKVVVKEEGGVYMHTVEGKQVCSRNASIGRQAWQEAKPVSCPSLPLFCYFSCLFPFSFSFLCFCFPFPFLCYNGI